jgi:hypothetical protein
MKFFVLLVGIIVLMLFSKNAISQVGKQQKFQIKQLLHLNNRDVDLTYRITEHSKLVAVGLNLSLGLFGVHRLYLGTSPKVPVIYTFTLGGGCIIFLGDLATIIFTKDLEQFTNQTELIMW